tara:strand:+ start:855 stop:998 length:144 start_codon:yes stop_codon:yes gene_type:complete
MAIGRSNIKQQITKAPAKKKIKKKPKNNKLSMLNLSTNAQKRKARRP